MSETIDIEKPRSPNPAWLAIPLLLFALVSLTVGLVARGTIRRPYPTPFFHLIFSDTLHFKVWLITAAAVLGFLQLLTAAHIYQLLRFPPPGRRYNFVHRLFGYTAVAVTAPVAYHCIFLLGFGTYDLRVYIHSILGSIVYGIFIAKVLLVRSERFPSWALPIAGGLLFATLLGLWLSSALWFFTRFGVGI
jgi:Family of unknown function (DUF6529)